MTRLTSGHLWVLGWLALAASSAVSLSVDDLVILAVGFAVLLPAEGFARSMSGLVAREFRSHADQEQPVRLAGALFRLASIGAALSALAVVGTPTIGTLLFLEDPTPVLWFAIVAGLRIVSSATTGLLVAANRTQAEFLVVGVRCLVTPVVAVALLRVDPTVGDVAVSAVIGEALALFVSVVALPSINDSRGWDLRLTPTMVFNQMVRAVAMWLPIGFIVAAAQRTVAIDLLALTWGDVITNWSSPVLFLSLGAASLLTERLAPPTGVVVASATLFSFAALLVHPGIGGLLWLGIVCILGPLGLSIRFGRQIVRQSVDPVNGEMSIIVTYSDPDLPMVTLLSSLTTMASRHWERFEIIAVSLDSAGGLTDRVQALDWDDLRHVSAETGLRGDAIRRAIRLSRSDRIALVDLDLRVDHSVLPHYADLLDQFSLDAVVGSRRHHRSVTAQLPSRALVSWLYQLWCKFAVDFRLLDARSGVKLFRRAALLDSVPFSTTAGASIDLELLGLVHRRGWSLADAPVIRSTHHPLPSAGESVAHLANALWIGTRLRLQTGVS